MKLQYVAIDGVPFDTETACIAHEHRLGLQRTAYAKHLKTKAVEYVAQAAFEYSKWLRLKQTYPATDSGEHKCCDLLIEMAERLTGASK